MSAITGIFYRDGRKVDPQQMKKMNDRLSHRGPDGSAIWCEGSVGLGHQMLWTTPESLHEKLPYHDKKAGLVITADARIDNRKELSKELNIEDKEDVSDSYFILKSYEKWGEKCPEYLLGDFAFAIWDENEEQLFCARDHMGVKPFYYYLDDDMFVFGTEIKAILSNKKIQRKINNQKIALFLIKDTSNHTLTFYKNIFKLPAANYFIIKNNKCKKSRYWKLNPNLSTELDSDEDYKNAFLQIFTDAVKCRLRTHFPLGFELSGGLDSSSIVCTAKKIIDDESEKILKNIYTFSRIYTETRESDERYYIKKITELDGIKGKFIKVDNISPLKNIKTILWYQEQPFYTPHMTKQIETYKIINKMGITTLISGQGGDQNLSMGTNYLRELATSFKWNTLLRELKCVARNSKDNVYKIFLEKIIFPSLPYKLKELIKLVLGKKETFIPNGSFLKNFEISEEEYNKNLDHLSKIKSKEYHYYVTTYAFNETVFETIDKRVAGFNIEVRYPFFDKRLIEFCYSIPSEMKYKHGWNRYTLRLAMENILPPEIQWRYEKTDLSPTYKKTLLFEENLLKKMIYDEYDIIENYVEIEKIKEIFEKNDSLNGKDLFNIWIFTILYWWLKINN